MSRGGLPAQVKPHQPDWPAHATAQASERVLRLLRRVPILQEEGRQFDNVHVDTGQTVTLNHALNRVPKGRIDTKRTGPPVEDGTYSASTIQLVNNGASDAVVSFYLY